ncbi:MAG: LysR family transcriptional regulator [Pseudomonadota bacterium]
MPRNLDLTALRSFVTVLETGGVTRAAHQLHLTQSAVSMQLKRLEESLGQPLLDRAGRGVAPTSQGEQLLAYGRRMLALNDEVWSRMTDTAFVGELTLGVPHDIVYPHIPQILRRFDREYPRLKIKLISSYTLKLRELMDQGELDIALTTEDETPPEAVLLARQKLVWVGAPAGIAWRNRPLRLAFERNCLFRPWALEALDRANIPWEMTVDTGSTRTVEATIAADLAINAILEGAVSPQFEKIPHGGALPDLPSSRINMYCRRTVEMASADALAELVKLAFQETSALQAVAAE